MIQMIRNAITSVSSCFDRQTLPVSVDYAAEAISLPEFREFTERVNLSQQALDQEFLKDIPAEEHWHHNISFNMRDVFSSAQNSEIRFRHDECSQLYRIDLPEGTFKIDFPLTLALGERIGKLESVNHGGFRTLDFTEENKPWRSGSGFLITREIHGHSEPSREIVALVVLVSLEEWDLPLLRPDAPRF